MGSQKKTVASFGLDISQAKQNLDLLRNAEQQFSAEGGKLASSLSKGFEDVEQKVARAYKKLSDGNKVSSSEFEGIVRDLAAVREAIEETGKPLEELPEQFQQALATAAQQISALNGAMEAQSEHVAKLKEEFADFGDVAGKAAEEISEQFGDIPKQINDIRSASDKTFSEQIDDLKTIAARLKEAESEYADMGRKGEAGLALVRAESKKVADALSDVQNSASSHLGKVRDYTIQTQREFDALAVTIAKNPKEAAEAFPKVAAQVVALERSIQAARAAGGPVDPATLALLEQFKTKLAAAKLEIGELDRAIKTQTAGIGDASQQWQGFGAVVQMVAGKFGAAGTGFLAGVAAIKAGWDLGMQFNQASGANMSAWESAISDATGKVRIAIEQLTEVYLASWKVQLELMKPGPVTEWYARVKQAAVEWKAEVVDGAKKIGNLNEALRAERAAHVEGVKWTEAHKEALKLATAAAEDLRKTKLAQIEAERDLTRAIREQNLEYEKAKKLKASVEARQPSAKYNESFQRGEVEEAEAALERQKRIVEELTAQYGEYDFKVQRAKEELSSLARALDYANERYARTQAEVSGLQSQWEKADSAIQQHKENLQKNAAAEAAIHQKTLDDLKAQRAGLIRKLNDDLKSQSESSPDIVSLKEKIAGLSAEIEAGAASYEKLREKADRLNTTYSTLSPAITEYQEMVRQATEAQAANSGSAGKQADAISSTGQAAAKAAPAVKDLAAATAEQARSDDDAGLSTIRWSDGARTKKQTADDAAAAVRGMNEATSGATRSTEIDTDAVNQNVIAYKERQQSAAEATASTSKLSEAQREQAQAANDGGLSTIRWSESGSGAKKSADEAADALRNMSEAQAKSTAASAGSSEAINASVRAYKDRGAAAQESAASENTAAVASENVGAAAQRVADTSPAAASAVEALGFKAKGSAAEVDVLAGSVSAVANASEAFRTLLSGIANDAQTQTLAGVADRVDRIASGLARAADAAGRLAKNMDLIAKSKVDEALASAADAAKKFDTALSGDDSGGMPSSSVQ